MSGALGDLERFLDVPDVHLQVEADRLLHERSTRVRFRYEASPDQPIQRITEADPFVALKALDGGGYVISERDGGPHAPILAS